MKLLRKLVTIVQKEESYIDDIKNFVPQDEVYRLEDEQKIRIHQHFYKIDPEIYCTGPVLGRTIGQIIDDNELWPENSPDEDVCGIYKLIIINNENDNSSS